MQGPSTAVIRSGAAPSPTIAATTPSSTPPSAPFQPACAAPITPASGSASRTGPQSAVSTPKQQARPIGHQRVGFGSRPRCPRARPRPAP